MSEDEQLYDENSLRGSLDYEPRELRFGTSGRRGDVVHLSQLEIYINVVAEIEYLQSLPGALGGIRRGDTFYYACDLRPSSSEFVEEGGRRGGIAQAVEQAILDAGMLPINLGRIPTPALTCYAIERGRGSIMVTGSHIPFDRNGYKTNTARGELLKRDEAPITERVGAVRSRIYSQPFVGSLFDAHGMLRSRVADLSAETPVARDAYVERYLRFFQGETLRGLRLLVYQHSAVGRDLLVEILERLGAEVVAAGRSETFVPIDTENIDDAQLAVVQAHLDEATARRGEFAAVVSTDGDSDRPLILGVDDGRARFFGGDLVGMIVAEYLGAGGVVVPITCNDAIDRGPLASKLEPKTKIGSPYVIAGMEDARRNGRNDVCGWEANGGFLTGSDFERSGNRLRALPTRDAVLPILCVLAAAASRSERLVDLFRRLPPRFSRAALVRRFPNAVAREIIARFAPPDPTTTDVSFDAEGCLLRRDHGDELRVSGNEAAPLAAIRTELGRYFRPDLGFGEIRGINYMDGVRIRFDNGDVAHIRPSGNADEFRIYAVADSQERADRIAALGAAEPDGILRRLERGG